MRYLKFSVLLLAFGLIVAACNHSEDSSSSSTTLPTTTPTVRTTTPTPTPGNFQQASLRTVDNCVALLEHFQTEALELVGPYGLNRGNNFINSLARGDVQGLAPPEAAQDSATSTPNFSTTNVQVKGVDEPDIVKTDGNRIVGVSAGELWIVDTTSTPPRKVGSLTLTENIHNNIELFLYEDKVLAFFTSFSYSDEFSAGRFSADVSAIYQRTTSRSHAVEIDISSNNPRILNELIIEGTYVNARRVGNTVNLVVRSQKAYDLGFVFPSNRNGEERAEAINRQIIEETVISDWLPIYNLVNMRNGLITDGLVSPCSQIHIPSEFSGLGLLSLVTIDLDSSLPVEGTASILADGETIYSPGETLYVAHQIYTVTTNEDDGSRRAFVPAPEIWFHKFATPAGVQASYEASGSADGTILSQFSMHQTADGHFWIVTTETTTPESEDGSFVPSTTESFVSSFRQDGTNLVNVGKVGNLGRNERVQSVRFIENTAYVVTFRRIDPFYVVDLRDATNPIVAGELKIPGFSSYLHPLGNGQLLGVGSTATDEGRVTGGKLSLFDASDPSNPLEVAILDLGEGYTNVTWDHRAFLYWDPENRVVLPFDSFQDDFFGALAIHLDPTATVKLREISRFEHMSEEMCDDTVVALPEPDFPPPTASEPAFCFSPRESISRSMVIGDNIWSLSNNYLEARNIASLTRTDSIKITS